MSKFKQWIIGKIAIKVAKLAISKADIKPYAITAATAVDKYLDKALGNKVSERIQNLIVDWLQGVTNAFSEELKKN